MADTVTYVVAAGVTLYVDDETTFYAGDVVTPDDFESLAEFKGLLAAGKIVEKQPDPPAPEPEKHWDGFSIDKVLDGESVNPVENAAVAKAIDDIIAGGAVAIPRAKIDALFA